MKNKYRILFLLGLLFCIPGTSKAGNDSKRSTAGAAQLMVNPWARSAGWGSVNTANGRGLDALYTNVAGIAFVEKTEFMFSSSLLFSGSGLNMNAAGFAQRVNETGVLAVSFMSIGGDRTEITRAESPEPGTNGTFRTTNMNINVSYAHAFSPTIYGGFNAKIVNEGTEQISAMGFAVDAGIQYVTGDNYQVKFGISLKNIGTKMSFGGSALARSVYLPSHNDLSATLEERAAAFDMPTRLNIGGSYDFNFENQSRLTFAGNFGSNAYNKDQFTIGAEYAFFKFFQVRSAYTFEKDIFSSLDRSTAYPGLTAGLSVDAPIGKPKEGKKQPVIAIDYAYRMTVNLGGTHTVGLGLNL